MGDSGSPSRQTTTAPASSVDSTHADTDAVAGAPATGGGSTARASKGTARAAEAPGISWASETAPAARSSSHGPRQISRQISQLSQMSRVSRESRESRDARSARPASQAGQQTPSDQQGQRETQQQDQSANRDQSPSSSTLGRSSSSTSKALQPSPASSTTPTRRRSFFSRFSLPFRTPTLSFADFYIRPAAPHRKYVAGDHVLGAIVLVVVKPMRITHLTVSLRGLVRVFKDPGAAATASLPPDTVVDSSSTSSRLLGAKKYGSSSSSSYLGNGHALLFRDEIVLSGNGLLVPGNYEFEFDLIFPAEGLPSSIDFERGSICYIITATLTRPTTVAPVQSCDRKIYLVDPVDISTVSKPRPRTISLEPISKRSKKRKMVVVTQLPLNNNAAAAAANTSSNTPTANEALPGAMSTISFASGGGSSEPHEGAFSERGSVRDSAHEPIHSDEIEQYAARHPRSPAPTDIRSEDSAETGASGSSANRSGSGGAGVAATQAMLAMAATAPGPGSGSGSGIGSGSGSGSGSGLGSGSGSGGLGGGIVRITSPTESQTAASIAGNSAANTTGTSSSTITNPGTRSQGLQPASSVSTATASGISDDRTITTTVELLKGGCLAGEVVNVKISVQHVKRIKSLHGVVVTLYRQGRIDSAPPELMFPSSGTSIAEEDESQSIAGGNGLSSRNGATESDAHDDQGTPSRKQLKQKAKEEKEREKQLRERAKDNKKNGKGKEVSDSGRIGNSGKRAKGGKHEYYLPKSKTGLGGLSLMSAGTCSVFRKDLSQSFSPLIIDPHTLQSSVTASVRVPEDAFATIKGVPGEMISFKYQLEVIVDLGGKLAGLLQSGAGGAGPSVVSGNPYDGKPIMSASSTLWGSGSHMIDTAPLRRQKGVICVPFEVVVGTTDTTRQRGRVNTSTTASDLPLLSELKPQQPPPQPHPSTQPPDWYPEDRKDHHLATQQPAYPSWPTNGAVASGSGSGPAAGSSGSNGHPYYQQQHQDPPMPYHQYTSHQPANYNYYDEPGSAGGSSRPPYTGALPPPSIQAPQYAPTDAMLATERDPNLSEKERIRRAEVQLLPSQPGQSSAAVGGSANGERSSRSHGGNHGPSAPSAPSLDEVAFPLPTAEYGAPSAPPDFASLETQASSPSFAGPAGQAHSAPATEDKQELERRRLLAEASAPPEFPEDYQDPAVGSSRSRRSGRAEGAGSGGGSGSGSGSGSRSSRAPSAPNASASALSGSFAASAPVLEEEDATHQQYLRQPQSQLEPAYPSQPAYYSSGSYESSAPYAPTGEQIGEAAEGPSAPPAALVPASDEAAEATASAPSIEEMAVATDEDHYGENYAYGPDATTDAAHGVGAAETAEALPRYER
ncbi:ph-response regulator protein palf rim8 [Ophiostoma piceae UAMH 11346]|uniref:Ph-response regulator protein palf rim8 n=1 Tax=Ophiostoma piceae (strain UAMH 11346) TaxID=1262450 RepID=S3BTZ4_OPHP1|nr:ph-response regulator protein palf rim8 [Ophiostoma piceae UAMH 11346]